MDTSGVTTATQAVINSTTTLTSDLKEHMVLIEPGPKISAAGENIQTFVESECSKIDGFAGEMVKYGNMGF